MRNRLVPAVLAGVAWLASVAAAADPIVRQTGHRVRSTAYQGRNRGPEETERFSRKIRISRNGSVSVTNVSGEISVTGGSGDEVSIVAVKRARGDRSDLGSVQIDVSEAPSRVDVRTRYPTYTTHHDHVSVDYTITMPASASLELHSVSGDVRVTGVQGSVRAEAVSGNIIASATPRLERVKSVSGDIDLTDIGSDGDMTAGSVSGSLRAKGLKSRGLDLSTVSGDVTLTDAACERLAARSLSGGVRYTGALTKNGRYDVTSHSGSVRLSLSDSTGFEVNANTFSGSIQSDFPLMIGGVTERTGRRRGMTGRSIHGTFGDASAVLTIRTFSGDITILKGK